jgi:tRNA A-37 threonylcarbamoyl transferase component Bud32
MATDPDSSGAVTISPEPPSQAQTLAGPVQHAVPQVAQPGTVLFGRFAVLELLGSGGMAFVYRATDQQLGTEVALKVLYRHLAAHEPVVQRFRREVLVSRRVEHPNVVTIYDLYGDENGPGLSMEYLPGGSLHHRLLRERRLPPTEALRITHEVCAGLHAAHRLGIVHRDVKPGNVLFAPDGRAKVSDFGLARLDDLIGLTTNSMVLGTPDYLAPEAFEGRPVDLRADVYAVGVMLYRMLTGSLPVAGPTLREMLAAKLSREPAPPSSLASEVPAGLDRVVLRCMSRSPDERYATCEELARALGPASADAVAALVVAGPRATSVDKTSGGRRCRSCGSPLLPRFNACLFCGAGPKEDLQRGRYALRLKMKRHEYKRGGYTHEQKVDLAALITELIGREPDPEELERLLGTRRQAVLFEGLTWEAAHRLGERLERLGMEPRIRETLSSLPRWLRYETRRYNRILAGLGGLMAVFFLISVTLGQFHAVLSLLMLSAVFSMLAVVTPGSLPAPREPYRLLPPLEPDHAYPPELLERLKRGFGAVREPRTREALARVLDRGHALLEACPVQERSEVEALLLSATELAEGAEAAEEEATERRLFELLRVQGRLEALLEPFAEPRSAELLDPSVSRLVSQLRLEVDAARAGLAELES